MNRPKYLSRDALPPLSQRFCQVCRKVCSSPSAACSGCFSATYCSRECQKRDWSSHKKACKEKLYYQIPINSYGALVLEPLMAESSGKLEEIGVTTPRNVSGLFTTGLDTGLVHYIKKQRGFYLIHDTGKCDGISILNLLDTSYLGDFLDWKIYYNELYNGSKENAEELLKRFDGADYFTNQIELISVDSPAVAINRLGELESLESGGADGVKIYNTPEFYRTAKIQLYNDYFLEPKEFVPVRMHFDGIGVNYPPRCRKTAEAVKALVEKWLKGEPNGKIANSTQFLIEIYREYQKVYENEKFPTSPHHKYEFTKENCYELFPGIRQATAAAAAAAAAAPAPASAGMNKPMKEEEKGKIEVL